MNLIFRLIYTLMFARFRSRVDFIGTCITPFRVYPTDLDVLRHMNNGKYFSLQDLARVDLMIRCGVKKILDDNGWYPVITAETLKFRRSLKLGQKFNIESRVVGWNEKAFVLEHIFKIPGGDPIALGYIMARFLKKSGGTIAPKELLETSGFPSSSPALPANAQQWIDSIS